MQKTMFAGALIAALLVGWLAHGSFAEEEAKPDDAAIDAMLGVHEPGPNQALLAQLVGTWDVEVKILNTGGQAVTSKATSVNEMLFDGRYLKATYEGDFLGRPFHGMGLFAHDNQKGAFQSMWIDSTSSGIYKAEGSLGEDGKTVTLRGAWESPDGPLTSRDVMRIESKDRYVMQGFVETPDGPIQNVELTYTRRAD